MTLQDFELCFMFEVEIRKSTEVLSPVRFDMREFHF